MKRHALTVCFVRCKSKSSKPTAQKDMKWKLLEKMVKNVKIDGGADSGHIRLKLSQERRKSETVLKWILGVMRLRTQTAGTG